MRFVALDLETTGLSPETDTIIEVAAVCFGIEQDNEGNYVTTNIEERSMLVSPGRDMMEEISMITGITDAMLAGKPAWGEVRERVREFIGVESIIVGHNVLFDVAMLETHGIDLREYATLDTFELSEILSQEAESLNLGFLAGLYGLSAGDKEHRALGDTRLSVGLFVHYLNLAKNLSESKKNIFQLAKEKESQSNLGVFVDILGWEKTNDSIDALYTPDTRAETITPKQPLSRESSQVKPDIYSLPHGRESEKEFLSKHIPKQGKTSIGVFGYQQVGYMQELTQELGFSSIVFHAPSEYCSIVELENRIVQGDWERKETILIIKLLMWLKDTKTGLLSELKLYGKEREEIHFFRMREGEPNPYYTLFQDALKQHDCIVYNLQQQLSLFGQETIQIPEHSTLIIKDIPLLEEAMRRSMSIHISIDGLIRDIEELGHTRRLVGEIRWIEGLYISFPERPTGPDVSPPGGYGETYFLTQSEIWQRGGSNLSIVNRALLEAYHEWISERTLITRRQELLAERIDSAIGKLVEFHSHSSSLGIILQVQNNALTLSLIPRDVREAIGKCITRGDANILYSIGITGERVRGFLSNELGLDESTMYTHAGTSEKSTLKVDPHSLSTLKKNGSLGGSVILTTSAKHIREIGKSLENTGLKILMQGISGGKGKQLGLFRNNPEGTVLVGTIDMWREELELWKHAKHIIIAKLPFDPPTDSYFLARTVGMKNNFTLYSEPMMIIKLNTLISRIRSTGYAGIISCEDNRLIETTWGQGIHEEIV